MEQLLFCHEALVHSEGLVPGERPVRPTTINFLEESLEAELSPEGRDKHNRGTTQINGFRIVHLTFGVL